MENAPRVALNNQPSTPVALVTGTGGGAGQAILKALQQTPYRVLAADGEVLAAGLYSAQRGYVVPYANAPGYVETMLEICRREKVGFVFPGLDAELPILSRNRERFAEIGTTLVVSRPEVVDLCDDKLATARYLQSEGKPFPETRLLSDFAEGEFPFPLILKPRIGGSRSQAVRMVRTPAEFSRARGELNPENFVAQELIEGPEYTCGTITLPGRAVTGIVLRRILRDGDTYKAFVERNEELEVYIREIAHRLQPFGPCNIQLRMRDHIPYIFELNARFSGTTYCRALAGFNEPHMIVDSLLRGTAPTFTARAITVLRYWKELVVENEAVLACESQREISVGVPL